MRPSEVAESDGDIRRNEQILSQPQFCISVERFTEGPLTWTLQIIEHKPGTVLWVVPHDNEHAAFDSAVQGLAKYGGVLVAVETGGSRFNGPQDPNRNFDIGNHARCPQQIAPSPVYTNRVLGRLLPGGRIVALHTNEPGFAGDGHGGRGTISIHHPLPNHRPFPAAHPITARSPGDTMIFVASVNDPQSDPGMKSLIDYLNGRGINVMFERVSAHTNDCSLSNYAALKGPIPYANLEVVDGDSLTQRRMIDEVMALWRIAPRPGPAVAAEHQAPVSPPAGGALAEAPAVKSPRGSRKKLATVRPGPPRDATAKSKSPSLAQSANKAN